ncbi:MAG: Mur ligase family protein [Verrucomicrobia bacterium]|nr:Mur ligase family protein [Verrucomicrobiota bacterium]
MDAEQVVEKQPVRLQLALLSARLAMFFIRLFKLGSGSSFPGRVASVIYPNIFQSLCAQIKKGIILVTGTNGKTTTSLLLAEMFLSHDVVHNKTGANFESGLTTALLEKAQLSGRLDADYGIFEVDELALVKILDQIAPFAIVAINLFRDQLSRYGEIQHILRSWENAILRLPASTLLFLNADDPAVCHLGEKLPQKVSYFGLNEPERYLSSKPQAADSIYCPDCDKRLNYSGFYLSHLGDYSCPQCSFKRKDPALQSSDWPQVSTDVYNKYNTMAAVSVAKEVGIDDEAIRSAILNFKPAFGRGESLAIDERKVVILLSKNPVSMNEMIKRTCRMMRRGDVETILFALNDEEMDGTDISWIWDVDLEPLAAKGKLVVMSGSRAHELALRFQYSFEESDAERKVHVEEDLEKAVAFALNNTPKNSTLPILPTYSAMLRIRKVLLGRQIL